MKVNVKKATKGNALVVKPGKIPFVKHMTLCYDELYEIVQGSLEIVPFIIDGEDFALVLNQDRDICGFPYNRTFCFDHTSKDYCKIAGTFMIVGHTRHLEIIGLSESRIRYFKKLLYECSKEDFENDKYEIMLSY